MQISHVLPSTFVTIETFWSLSRQFRGSASKGNDSRRTSRKTSCASSVYWERLEGVYKKSSTRREQKAYATPIKSIAHGERYTVKNYMRPTV